MGITDRVRDLAAQNKTTIAGVEKEMGFGQGSIRKWNSTAPSADKLYKVAKRFNVSMEYLLTGDNGSQSISSLSVDGIKGISQEAIRMAVVWDNLDEAGKAITLGEIFKRAEAMNRSHASDSGAFRKAK